MKVKGHSEDQISFDHLVIASGGQPRKLDDVEGGRLGNIFVLRSPADANRIAEKSKGKDVVIAGASFIGSHIETCFCILT